MNSFILLPIDQFFQDFERVNESFIDLSILVYLSRWHSNIMNVLFIIPFRIFYHHN